MFIKKILHFRANVSREKVVDRDIDLEVAGIGLSREQTCARAQLSPIISYSRHEKTTVWLDGST